jgi:hypothetical protein
MFQDASQPDMSEAQVFNRFKGGVVNIIESAAAIFGLAAVQSEFGLFVSEQSGK